MVGLVHSWYYRLGWGGGIAIREMVTARNPFAICVKVCAEIHIWKRCPLVVSC